MKSQKTEFLCLNCKNILENNNAEYFCTKCGTKIRKKDNFIDFIDNDNYGIHNIPKVKLDNLIQKIKNEGFKNATTNFLKNNPKFTEYISDVKAADNIFHGIKQNNFRCLDIGSELGNNSEVLSKIYQDVYSLEWKKEKIEFQKIRINEKGIKNITIIRCDPLTLPFPDNYFDLVLCNKIIELANFVNNEIQSKELQKKFLSELKRVIKNDGCFCLGIENKTRLNQLLKNNVKSKKFEKSKYKQYQKIFNELEINSEVFWVLPSLSKPYFSGKLNDKNSISWFYNNLKKFLLKEKQGRIKNLMLSLFEKINKLLLNSLTKQFMPNLLFCCSKSKKFYSYESLILNESKYSNFLSISRSFRIKYILFDSKNEPSKIISINRFGTQFPKMIEKCKREIQKMEDPKSRVWVEDWLKGDEMDPKNFNDILSSINWLIEFQNLTKNGYLSKNDKEKEIFWFRNQISKFPEINILKYQEVLDDYEKFLLDHKIIKTAHHGDFWYTNILIDKKTRKVNVIDWENYKEYENPFYDLLTFLLHFMMLRSKPTVKIFQDSLELKGIFGNIINETKSILDNHFGFKINLIILLRFFILRHIIWAKIFGKEKDDYIQLLEIILKTKQLGMLKN